MSKSFLNVGDKITWQDSLLERPAQHAVVERHEPDGSVTVSMVGSGFVGMARAEHEGLTWIRGHHPPNSPAANAIRAAYILVDPFGLLSDVLTRR